MSQRATVYVQDNRAEFSLPTGRTVQVKAKSNAKTTQKVTLRSADGAVDLEFTGTGERTQFGEATITPTENFRLHAVFEFAGGDGVFRPSTLNSGGPYEIGTYNLLVVAAENGDDTDHNDTILEFSWHTR